MDTSLPTPMTARVYVNLPEGKLKTWSWCKRKSWINPLIAEWWGSDLYAGLDDLYFYERNVSIYNL